jgi:uncharacterized repeat protein (TIGR01451 family)
MSGTPSLGNLSIQNQRLHLALRPGSGQTGPATAAPGAVVTYTLSYSNTSGGPIPAPATGVQLTDTLPAGLTYVSGSASCTGTCSGTPSAVGDQIVWNLGTLPLGASGSQTFQATVSLSATDGQTLVNAATIASAENDAVPADNDTTFTTTVATTPTDLRLPPPPALWQHSHALGDLDLGRGSSNRQNCLVLLEWRERRTYSQRQQCGLSFK